MTPSSIACIGAAHVDRRAHALGPVVPGSSNPVRIGTASGGVARNVAENLARLGCAVSLVSRVGSDPEGAALRAGLADLGIDIAGLARSDTASTASYTALLDPSGELVVGLADMAIYDELTPAALEPLLPALARHA